MKHGKIKHGKMEELINSIDSGCYDDAFAELYPRKTPSVCRKRYIDLINLFIGSYGDTGGCVGGVGGECGDTDAGADAGTHGGVGGECGDADAGADAGTHGGVGGECGDTGASNSMGSGGCPILVSAPGRTEICGNHTDHQHGNVLAAAIDMDIICVAAANGSDMIRIKSVGHPGEIAINLGETGPIAEERGNAQALIRGLAAWFKKRGIGISGFSAYTTSDVPVGSGLSSSAAFEVAIGVAMNTMFDGGLSALDIAIAGQFAENQYFGKPCGLMDQTASSVGGFVRIDFADPRNPVVEPINCNLAVNGLSLCVVDTKGSHENLIGEYAAIPAEMRAVAELFGERYLRDVNPDDFFSRLAEIREKLRTGGANIGGVNIGGVNPSPDIAADRALLRAIHYFNENRHVVEAAQSLRAAEIEGFLDAIIKSGRSSNACLQNIFAVTQPGEQGLSIALALSEAMLLGSGGAWRVHGGGFAGTIIAFVPQPLLEKYISKLNSVFGEGSCLTLSVRRAGGIALTTDLRERLHGGTAI